MARIKGTLVMLSLNEIEGAKALFPKIPIKNISEVFVVDGGSTDGTIEFFKKNNIKVIAQKSKGRGEAFRIAVKEAKYDNLVFFSMDGNEDPKDIEKIFNRLDEENDMVIASRFMKGARADDAKEFIPVHSIGNTLFTKIINFIWRGKLTDSINGFRGITKQAFNKIKPDATGFAIEFQISIRALKTRMNVAEFPTIEGDRIGGKSSVGALSTGIKFLRLILKELFL